MKTEDVQREIDKKIFIQQTCLHLLTAGHRNTTRMIEMAEELWAALEKKDYV